ncbi:MAG: glycosyltransferase family 4 protein [Chloroflexota bacterium]|nr:glycosyltransferase family 4 protein [Chloroflexota bacterium]
MKIALVYDALYPFMKGGAEKRYHEMGTRLAARHEVHFVSWEHWRGSPPKENGNLFYHGVGRPLPFYDRNGKRRIAEAVGFASHLLKAFPRERFDVIDCSSIPYFPAYACRLISLARGIPLVVTWHEFWGDYWLGYLGWRGHLARAVELAATGLGDMGVAVSQFTADRVARQGLKNRPIEVIPNGIEYGLIRSIPPNGEESDVIYMGRLIGHKNVSTLLEAVRLLANESPRLRCLIVGDGPERESLARYSSVLGLDGNVAFLGFIPDQRDMFALMKRSKVFVFPSTREGFGRSVVEAQACGLPAVVVRAPDSASPTLIRSGDNGLVCDNDARSLATALAHLLEDQPLRQQMAEAAQAEAARYDWSNVVERIEGVYQQAIGRRNGNGLSPKIV